MSKTRKEKVLTVLEEREGWVDGSVLCRPDVGGSEGLRRLRELRSDGYEITKRRKKGSTQFQYRLETANHWTDRCSCIWNHHGDVMAIEFRDPDCEAMPHPRRHRRSDSE